MVGHAALRSGAGLPALLPYDNPFLVDQTSRAVRFCYYLSKMYVSFYRGFAVRSVGSGDVASGGGGVDQGCRLVPGLKGFHDVTRDAESRGAGLASLERCRYCSLRLFGRTRCARNETKY